MRGLVNPVTGVFSDDGRSLYVGSLGNGGIFAFARDSASGRLAPVSGGPARIGHQVDCDRSAQPMPHALAHDGRFVFLAAAEGVTTFGRGPGGALRPLRGKAACNVMPSKFDTPALRRQCRHGDYELPGLTGFEVAPGGRDLYALERAYRNGYGTGAVQLMKRH